ncbi:MAG: ABC transporter ATP-binding protein/permease [Lachnospiraceae bacterium]|nr:ABC transporter ATP-binding protein/permease [Lachnospiraceae bacterium]
MLMKLKKRIILTMRGYGLLKEYCPGLIAAKVWAAAADTLSPFVTIWFSACIINEIAGAGNVTRLGIYVLLTVIINFALSMIKNALNKVVDEKESGMWNYFPKIFADKQMSMDYADLEDQDIQKKKQKAQENLFMFGNGLGQLVWDTAGIVQVIVGIIASVSLTASLFVSRSGNALLDSWIWLPAGAVIVLIAGISTGKLRQRAGKAFDDWTVGTVWYNRAFMFYGHELYDDLSRAKDVRIYRQDRIADREMEKLNTHNKDDRQNIRKMSRDPALIVFIQGICNALCYAFVAAKAAMGAFAIGSIVQYAGALIKLVQSIGELVDANYENVIYTGHLEKLFEYLDIENGRHRGELVPDAGSNAEHRIEFKNVSFRYPGSDRYALKRVNALITSGKKQALVGANGAGKTTFVKLLCRLYDPEEGEILLDGKDIREYNYEEYLKLFAYVFQDFKLFSLSLGENIAAAAEYDLQKLEECISRACFEERYRTMSAGAETYLYKDIAEDGVMISGGEAQKIALARALYKDAPVMILDEPTAALDPIAEAQVFSDFDRIIRDKTAIYVSHRLSSCRFCDEIMVFDEGSIVQIGSHEELCKDMDGVYYGLWNAQARYYQNDDKQCY